MMALCPSCLQTVEEFTRTVDQGSAGYSCPACYEPVPLRYVVDYESYPPVVFSLTGLRGHGKTVFMASLLHELERVGAEWPGFSYTPLDEDGLEGVREK